jgi:hypothetical protein
VAPLRFIAVKNHLLEFIFFILLRVGVQALRCVFMTKNVERLYYWPQDFALCCCTLIFPHQLRWHDDLSIKVVHLSGVALI